MKDDRGRHVAESERRFSREVAGKARRKQRSARPGRTSVWYGLGMSGLIGWSIAIPTLGGALLGLWLDRHYPAGRSWTLMLLLAGLVVGCAMAFRWISREHRSISEETEDRDD